MAQKRLIKTTLIIMVITGSVLVTFKFICGSRISELLESHDLGNNRRLEVYHVMSHATVANYVDVYLIDKNKFVFQRQTLLEARMVGSVHIELLSSDSAMAYIYSYSGSTTETMTNYYKTEPHLLDSVTLLLTGDHETISWR